LPKFNPKYHDENPKILPQLKVHFQVSHSQSITHKPAIIAISSNPRWSMKNPLSISENENLCMEKAFPSTIKKSYKVSFNFYETPKKK
jgi:hypothetical protein